VTSAEEARTRGGRRTGGAEPDVGVGRGEATRNAILDAALRLFAERGVTAVSNRQIGAAAGKGNTSVVGYYFASKADLVRALVRRFNTRVNVAREARIARLGKTPDLRDWVGCLVHPYTEFLNTEGPLTWDARFVAQLLTDPALRAIAVEEASTQSLRRTLDGLGDCMPEMPVRIMRERSRIASHVIVQMCAEREHALAEGLQVHPQSWDEVATGLVDVIVAMWTAPVTAAEDDSAG
jgi:AcrR family transcriptional regulator